MFGLAYATNQDTLLGKKYKTKLGIVARTKNPAFGKLEMSAQDGSVTSAA